MVMEPKEATQNYFVVFVVIMFMLCYWFDQKTRIAYTGSYNFI